MKAKYKDYYSLLDDWVDEFESAEVYGGRVYTQGYSAYSYGSHYCMARFCPEQEVFLVNDTNYSPTTGRHMSAMRSALRNKKKIYVDKPDDVHGSITILLGRMSDTYDSYRRSRKYKNVHLRQFYSDKEKIELLCSMFKRKLYKHEKAYINKPLEQWDFKHTTDYAGNCIYHDKKMRQNADYKRRKPMIDEIKSLAKQAGYDHKSKEFIVMIRVVTGKEYKNIFNNDVAFKLREIVN